MSFAELSLREFVRRVSAKEPTPGGGAVCAAGGAAGAAMAAMVARYTTGRKKFIG